MYKQIDIAQLMEEARQRRNRRLILIFVFCWIGLFLAIVLGAGVHAQEATTPTLHAAGQLNSVSKANPISDLCTVFRVTDELAASAGHCVLPSNPDQYSIELGDGKTVTARVAAFSDPASGIDDWALFKRTGVDPWPAEWEKAKLDCAGDVLPIGADVRAEGYPHVPANFLVVWGRISGAPKAVAPWEFPVLYHNLAIEAGDSGGPLYNDKTNEVIGILVGVSSKNPSLSVSQPIASICTALHLS